MASSISITSPSSAPTVASPSSPLPSLGTASAKSGGLHPDGPSFPSTFSPGRAQHARRPSRAERYEALVASARDVLKRGSVGLEEIGLGLDGDGMEEGREPEKLEPVDEREWRDAVRSLLKVVDGMTHQLSTHDELAAQLKIAQSNLTLAETHSEFLEEELRRRDRSNSHSMGRQMANGGSGAPPLLRQRATTDEDSTGLSNGGLFGLGLSGEDPTTGGAKSFFRLPSKRKPTPSTASIASTSTTSSMPPPNPPYSHALRSVSSSPRLGNYSPNPASPSFSHPRFSTSTTASSIDENSASASHFPSTANTPPSPAELFALQTHIASLETECSALRSNNTSLRRSNETVVGKCAELEKTKENLMSELESLSVELFSEANTLVAEERRARAKTEEEVTGLRAEIDSLNQQLEILRQLVASRSSSSANAPSPSLDDPTSPALPALPSSEPETPPIGISSTLEPYHGSPGRLPSRAAPPSTSTHERPMSTVSVASTSSSSGRKWFSFGRSASTAPESMPTASTSYHLIPKQPARAASYPVPSGSLQPPAMQRGDSGSSHTSDASATSFLSFRTAATGPASADADGKGKGKARELDLGIYIPTRGGVSMAKTDSEGGRTVGLRTPLAPEHAHNQASRQPLPPSPLPSPGMSATSLRNSDLVEHLSSPPLPPLPPVTPNLPSSASITVSLPSSPTSQALTLPQPPHSASALSPSDSSASIQAPHTARPSRNGAVGPRPLAIHANLAPTVNSPSPFSPFDPSSLGINGDVGGPREADMTAASKSPKSPNAMRWTEKAGTLATSPGEPKEQEWRPRTRTRSNSSSRGENGRGSVRDKLPPSPALPSEFKDAQASLPLPPPPPPPHDLRAPSPIPPTSSRIAPPPPPPTLKIKTSTVPIVPPVLVGGVRALATAGSARPASPLTVLRRPSLKKAASSTGWQTPPAPVVVPRTSAVPLAPTLPSQPPASTSSSSTSTVAASAPAAHARPNFLRANSASSSLSGMPSSSTPTTGMTPSTSASSLASRFSANSGSSTATGSTTRLLPRGGGGGETSRPLTPGGEKAVEDLEALMRNIMEMEKGLMSEEEEGEGPGEGGKEPAKDPAASVEVKAD
ncbi:hypothetical protein JCM11641_005004 [Rhodosporidiobolus odoratus]